MRVGAGAGAGVVVVAGLLMAADDLDKGDLDRIQGTWTTVSFEVNGQAAPPEVVTGITTDFKGKDYVQSRGATVLEEGTFKLDPDKKPPTIDFKIVKGQGEGKDQFGIYEFVGDTLRICIAPPGAEVRPTEFKTAPDSQTALILMKREKP